MIDEQIIVHTDGGARGNPGPAACAFIVETGGKLIKKGSLFLGKATNNTAEYQGVILALKWLIENKVTLSAKEIVFYLDSELIVRQISGIYKVKDENLRNLFSAVSSLLVSIGKKVVFRNVPREKNKIADLLVNKALDENL